jgi:hypothetical protein
VGVRPQQRISEYSINGTVSISDVQALI